MGPIILYVTIHSNCVIYYWIICALLISAALKLINSNSMFSSDLDIGKNNCVARILRLMIQTFRMLVVVISSVCILAVDFFVFPGKHVKTHRFGFSLMDVGVGFFILCHSTRAFGSSNKYKTTNDSITHIFILM